MKQINQTVHADESGEVKMSAKQAHQSHLCAKCHKTLDIEIDPRLEGPHLCFFCSIPNATKESLKTAFLGFGEAVLWTMGNETGEICQTCCKIHNPELRGDPKKGLETKKHASVHRFDDNGKYIPRDQRYQSKIGGQKS